MPYGIANERSSTQQSTGWPGGRGLRAELAPVTGLSPELTGVTGDGAATLFVALARLTGEPDPLPPAELVCVETDGDEHGYEVRVSRSGGPAAAFRFTAVDEVSAGPSWSVTPR
ncbi:hypothetical protein [Streptomyces sp. Ru62]|uniref:hypothetical protein n=1 Tax=Streptomyces sp. Ru62 TaxID=2080745 RepID=UPI0026C013A7|nr:hypothetical protein [Streptomyces sp. Ru62]